MKDIEEITEEEIKEFCNRFFKKIRENPEDFIKIVIGEKGSGSLYTLQQLKDEFKTIITNDDLIKFELKNKMFIDKDWEYYFQY